MHENTLGIVTILINFLINLMFSKLDKFDEPIFKGAYIRGGGRAYTWDVNWATYLEVVDSGGWGVLYTAGWGRVLTVFYGIYINIR